MNLPDAYDFLDKPLEELDLSSEFLQVLQGNGVSHLRQIIDTEAYKLLELPGFGYRMLHEFISLLQKYHAEHLLRE